MKVGTDGVLLGAWADINGVESVLDVGCGSGLILLMIAQRLDVVESLIVGVETDKNAWDDAVHNVYESKWAKSISVINADFLAISGKWDLIISNPPFFSTTLKSPEKSRSLARHGGSLNYFSLIQFASRVLSKEGSLAFISDTSIPPSEIIFEAEINRLKLRRQIFVASTKNGEIIRILWQFKRRDGLIEKGKTFLRNQDNGTMSDQYLELTKDFYL